MRPEYKTSQSGFTLIELSIVLVIIGLIVGGVLVGQDLIKAAEIRATVSQFEKYDAAANAFRNKYNGLPGDMANPTNFFAAVTGLTGNNNRIVERSTDDGTTFDDEAAAFFKHLALASLIADNIAGNDVTPGSGVDAITDYAPLAKIGIGSVIFTGSNLGLNYYFIGRPAATDGALTFTDGTAIPVISALQIDTKLDDGNPTSGRVRAYTNMNTADAGAAGATADECVDTTSPGIYQTSTTAIANDTECTLRVRTSF